MIGLLEAIFSILLPVLLGILVVAIVFTWCGKTKNLREGVNVVISGLTSLLGEDKVGTIPEFFEIEEREFAGLKNRVSEYFTHFVFICARNYGNYLAVQYRIGDKQVSDEVVEQEWINFLKSAFCLPNHIKIPVLVVHDVEAGLLYLYYAWTEDGIRTLEEIRNNVKSRKIPSVSNDIIL